MINYGYKLKVAVYKRPSVTVKLFTARKRSLGQGNMFTPVCHSVRGGEGGSGPGGGGGLPGPTDQIILRLMSINQSFQPRSHQNEWVLIAKLAML